MKKKAFNHKILFASILVIILIIFGFEEKEDNSFLSKPTTNDYYNYIAINEIKMWVSNNGDGSHDPNTGSNGFYWPGGENAVQAAIFEDGLVWGGIVDSIRFNGNTHVQGLQAGKILPGGNADDPNLQKYRVYKILKGWENLPYSPVRDRYELDFNEWPVDDGAPWIDVNGDNIYTVGIDSPKYVGDETLWYVANDMSDRTYYVYGSPPIGLEFQTTIWGFDNDNFLADVVFKKYRIINRSPDTIDSMYFTYWMDDDVGYAADDFVGFDTTINLGYTYNADNFDDSLHLFPGYGTPPPAVGHMFVQGPIIPGSPDDSAHFNGQWRHGYKNLPVTSSGLYSNILRFYWDPSTGDYSGTLEMYNNMRGFNWAGSSYVDPHTGIPTKFPLAGDPVSATGWYEGTGWPGGPQPGDRRSFISSGPITMSPGDTQEVIIALPIAIGYDHINSIAALKDSARLIHQYFGNTIPTKLETDMTTFPGKFNLYQNYPNPFNPLTKIEYSLVKPGKVELIIFDILGREVTKLVNETKQVGKHEVIFDASNYASGLYFYKLKAGDPSTISPKRQAGELYIQTRKMLLMK